MKTSVSLKNRQGGAVAIIVGISMVMLIGFLALVIDLGHLYLAKTGLQNAADAAALSGAKELVGTTDGINNAVDWAQKLTAQGSGDNNGNRNRFFGSLGWQDVALTADNIHFSDSPYPSAWLTVAQAQAQPAVEYFIKVDTQSGSMGTWFANIWNIFNISTYGSAVAGRFITPIVPLGVCAIDRDNPTKVGNPGKSNEYKLEYGYAYGLSYNFGLVNKVIGGLSSGDPLYLHPTAQTQPECVANQNNANYPVPFMCTGRTAISGHNQSFVYANTGWGGPDIYDAINTRFVFAPSLSSKYGLDANICRPDSNIKEFKPSIAFVGAGWMGTPLALTSPLPTSIDTYQTVNVGSNANDNGKSLVTWLAQLNVGTFANINTISARPEASGGCIDKNPPIPYGPGPAPGSSECSDNYGVLWSYTRPTNSSGTPIPTGIWNTGSDGTSLYPRGPTYTGNVANLWAPGAGQSPYSYGIQSHNSNYYTQPASNNGQRDRRVLNMVILDCKNVQKNPGCDGIPVLSVGKFFMQAQADYSTKTVEGEFAGMIPEAALSMDIRLYR